MQCDVNNYTQAVGVGCHINGEFSGAFGYHDDILLLSHSLYTLKHYITVCDDYAKKRFNMLFKPIKSKLISCKLRFVLYLYTTSKHR